eukprot:1162143-Pelagomonas_calceolata.AAC.10
MREEHLQARARSDISTLCRQGAVGRHGQEGTQRKGCTKGPVLLIASSKWNEKKRHNHMAQREVKHLHILGNASNAHIICTPSSLFAFLAGHQEGKETTGGAENSHETGAAGAAKHHRSLLICILAHLSSSKEKTIHATYICCNRWLV